MFFKKVLLFLLISSSYSVAATLVNSKKISEPKITKTAFLGHLLTPTTHLPKKKTATLGTHVTGYSPSDNLLVGSASFLYLFYNSPNIYLKYGKKINEKQRWATQLNYLKSSENFNPIKSGYVMEAFMGWGIWSYDITPFYTLHTSFNYMHFFNEGNPHSLRREPFNDQPYQLSITTLHDVKVTKRYGIASEIGILGLNYEIPNLHGAVSFRYTGRNFFVQFGISFDSHLPFQSFDAINYARNNQTLDASHTKEFITHPEMAFQYFF